MTLTTVILLSGAAGAFVGGIASRRLERWLGRRRRSEFRRLLLAEYAYWTDENKPGDGGDDFNTELIRMGACGAVSNVLGAMEGHPAPWHKRYEQGEAQERPGSES